MAGPAQAWRPRAPRAAALPEGAGRGGVLWRAQRLAQRESAIGSGASLALSLMGLGPITCAHDDVKRETEKRSHSDAAVGTA